jgi:hypothetical protein
VQRAQKTEAGSDRLLFFTMSEPMKPYQITYLHCKGRSSTAWYKYL